jgi:hypothetical protein
MAGPDLICLLFKSFEISVVDFADDINKDSTLAIRFMNRDGRGQTAPFGQRVYCGSDPGRSWIPQPCKARLNSERFRSAPMT